ncbi:radical SAM family heme chaperone HemW [Polymorphobacter fuscus]|uniref:Heme chaperone HemW n=1 Tax=Sandarakinorhabdus fusca TaxID=1439888 RepID=A0A7C9GWD6_9SPHN|nr:radical SAM family heme chaperone HemW [Polymorphobacter fuscus]KAB7645480.1 coproporphyrinogen III oxidase [Polymorphobacter fuscus]MQT17909.1 coproporphyrinogen III oxidase [Polymorphobacter fuscus]NJC08539.1 oxygen-independent coproporphyrinogen-3 oxidase [Polymorphobacter fuscus]
MGNPIPAAPDPIALYVHWPFCVTKCPYCDFNSHVRASIDDNAWRTALLADLAHEAARLPGRRLASIFFGGGTPSLMPPATVAAIIDAATHHWPAAPDIEITLEANPSSVEAARFAGFAAAGVNRLSLGLQALNDADLKALGRPHDLAQGLAALDIAQANFARVSFDLIYDRPGMTPDSWAPELARAIAFGTSHLSLYQLTLEPGTRFTALHARGQLDMPDSDTSADLFDLTRAMTADAGLFAYEVSNHARPGAESRHNLAYWTYGDYAGIGPGAHGRRQGVATARLKKPEAWLAGVAAGSGRSETLLTPDERATEALVMGLRLAAGIDAARFQARTGLPLAAVLRPDRVVRLVDQGLLEQDTQGLRLTAAGQPFVDAVLKQIAA